MWKTNTKDIRIIIGCYGGYMYEGSFDQGRIINKFEKLINDVRLITLAPNNKSFFVVDPYGNLYIFDMLTKKCSKKIFNAKIYKMVITYDGRYLITSNANNTNINFWFTRNLKLKNSLISDLNKQIYSLKCSYDNKYLFLGHKDGYLSIVDIKKFQNIGTFKIILNSIYSMAIFRDNQQAIVSDWKGNVIKIKWDLNASAEDDFQISEIYGKQVVITLFTFALQAPRIIYSLVHMQK